MTPLDLRGMGPDDAMFTFGAWLERIIDDKRQDVSFHEDGLLYGYVQE